MAAVINSLAATKTWQRTNGQMGKWNPSSIGLERIKKKRSDNVSVHTMANEWLPKWHYQCEPKGENIHELFTRARCSSHRQTDICL